MLFIRSNPFRRRRQLAATLAGVIAAGACGSALGQTAPAQPDPLAPAAAPPPDPNAWWTAGDPNQPDAYDPLGNRRWNKRDEQVRRGFSNGVDASLYRLWGLQPLLGLSLRRGEVVYEMWFRPTDSTRQAVVRVILRADGETFVQARAGRGCCGPEIARRVDINAQLTGEQRRELGRLREDAAWSQPRNVVVSEGEGVVSSLCVDGASYDLTLLDDRRAVHLRRSCDPAEIGSAVHIAQALVGAALGKDPRFDVIFADQPFAKYRTAHAQLVESGGRIRAVSDDIPNTPLPPPPELADEREEAEQAILAADRAFAARASQTTAAQAFREFMDGENGLLFRPGGEPLEGAEAIYGYMGGAAPETGKLLWEPVQAWASESGDFGASWGRSRFVPNGAAAPTRAYRYMTVWRRDADGAWKGLMDMGAPADDLVPRAAAPVPPLGSPLPGGPTATYSTPTAPVPVPPPSIPAPVN